MDGTNLRGYSIMKICKIEICVDCLNYLANGEVLPDVDQDNLDMNIYSRYPTAQYQLIPEGVERGFSHATCDTCGGMAGDRYSAHVAYKNYIQTAEFRNRLVQELTRIQSTIDSNCILDDGSIGIDVTLGVDDTGTEYAIQTGDNSFSGPIYIYEHWAVSSITPDMDKDDINNVAMELIYQVKELVLY